MFFWNKFCGLLLFIFIFINFSYAQSKEQTVASDGINSLNNSLSFFKTKEIDSKLSFLNFSSVEHKYLSSPKIAVQPLENFNIVSSSILPGNFAACKYGFFCRQELKIEKATNLPVRVRLGSLAQCNYYEGKP
ncbi:MAG: hypothetical protein ABI366_09960 [Ginsengibacter sp.]